MDKQDEERIRVIIREELAEFFHRIETQTGQTDSQNFEGDTQSARGLLRLLFIEARDKNLKDKLNSGND